MICLLDFVCSTDCFAGFLNCMCSIDYSFDTHVLSGTTENMTSCLDLLTLIWRQFHCYLTMKYLISFLYFASSFLLMRPMIAKSSEKNLQVKASCVISEVQNIEREEKWRQDCILLDPHTADYHVMSETQLWSLTYCGQLVRYSRIQDAKCWSTPVWSCLSLRSTGCVVLKAFEKLKNDSQCSQVCPSDKGTFVGWR